MMLYICTKCHENILDDFQAIKFHLKNSKGHNSEIMQVELRFLFCVHRLIVVYICTKFRDHIFKGINAMERTR